MKVNGRMNEIKYVQDLDISELVKSELIHEPWQIISENLRYQNLDLNDYEAALKIGPEGIEIIREQLTEIIRHRKVQEIMIVNFILKIEPIYQDTKKVWQYSIEQKMQNKSDNENRALPKYLNFDLFPLADEMIREFKEEEKSKQIFNRTKNGK